MLEIVVTLVLVGILSALSYSGMGSLIASVSRQGFAADVTADLGICRQRALSRQTTQILFIDATSGANKTFGYYHFEDAATTPNIFAALDLQALVNAAIAGTFDPAVVTTAPYSVTSSAYVLRSLQASSSSKNMFYMNAAGWKSPPAFPFASVPVNTTAGCSFCTSGYGAVGFLPSGKVVFSDLNTTGGILVVQAYATNVTQPFQTGIGLSTSGFFQKLVQ